MRGRSSWRLDGHPTTTINLFRSDPSGRTETMGRGSTLNEERGPAAGNTEGYEGPPHHRRNEATSASEKLKDALLGLVGLSQHGGTGLGQDLRAAICRHFHRHVGVTNT